MAKAESKDDRRTRDAEIARINGNYGLIGGNLTGSIAPAPGLLPAPSAPTQFGDGGRWVYNPRTGQLEKQYPQQQGAPPPGYAPSYAPRAA